MDIKLDSIKFESCTKVKWQLCYGMTTSNRSIKGKRSIGIFFPIQLDLHLFKNSCFTTRLKKNSVPGLVPKLDERELMI